MVLNGGIMNTRIKIMVEVMMIEIERNINQVDMKVTGIMGVAAEGIDMSIIVKAGVSAKIMMIIEAVEIIKTEIIKREGTTKIHKKTIKSLIKRMIGIIEQRRGDVGIKRIKIAGIQGMKLGVKVQIVQEIEV